METVEESNTITDKKDTRKNNSTEINFDADISQLMNLIINSFYSK